MIGCAAIALVYGQRPMSPERITALRGLSTDLHQQHLAERRQVVRLAAAAGIPVRRVLPDGRTAELQRFIDGRPLCYITTNLNAARIVSTDLVWPGGGRGLDLTGAGITAGIWDDGRVLTSHQEFGEQRVILADGSTASDHPTHVAGTMIAGGVDPKARGMANDASLESYDWLDDSGEMAAAAAAGLALSNHSYSYIVGWQEDYPNPGWYWWGDVDISLTEDYFFGFYDSTAHNWDQIAVNAPSYLIVAAAGNDRAEDGPTLGGEHWVLIDSLWVLSDYPRDPDGVYDCLPGGPQVAKNVLVVGAVDDIPDGYTDHSDVIMTPFSSWGPTDDGRIKPDLVANGMEVYSTLASSDAAYNTLSGTSMAAASVTGSVALLQQHYADTHDGQLPLAATLRALLIHTADEAGTSPGPDYSYGWGLLNTAAAADLISRDTGEQWTIKELTLNEGVSYYTTVTSNGPDPLKVTIAWTDPPATPLSPALNDITARLINDLDLRITRESDGQTYYPWYLDVGSPAAAAIQTTDNDVDNVEQVLVPTPGPGEYIVTVSHKSALLADVQDFSMVITGASMPQVLVWEGDSAGIDYSGVFIRDTLPVVGDVDVTYTTTFPESLSVFDAAFLSFGPSGADVNRTPLNTEMAAIIQAYLEGGGSLYLESGQALGEDQAGNSALFSLLGIGSVAGGYEHSIDTLVGQTSTIVDGMLFTASTQEYSQYIDLYTPGTGTAAFVESNYGTVAVQNTGSYGQRTFVFSYALAELVDGDSPSTQSDLLAALLDFFLAEPLPLTAVNDSASTLEDSSVTISVLANDIDQASAPVSIAAVTHGDHGIVVIDAGDTTVTYTPEADFFGPDSFTYTISNGWEVPSTARVYVSVDAANDPPVFISTIADTSFKEDSTLSLPLSLWFHAVEDEETPDSQLIWSITGNDSVSTTFSADADSVLFAAPLNWHGEDTLSVIASDGAQADTTALIITVFPVNDAPGNFVMLTPASDFTLVITNENLGDALTFSWESAEDVDGDSVWYCFDATGTLAAIVPSGDTSATELQLAYSGLVPLIREAGESGCVTGTWTIKATDGTDTTRAANGPFGLTLDISRLGIDGQDDIPKEFALRQNYPNPFNPSTTLRFALPRAVEVRLVVVDLLGREIARLVDETLPAGYHQVTWNGKTHGGKEAPSGVYIARIMAPEYIKSIKMLLLR